MNQRDRIDLLDRPSLLISCYHWLSKVGSLFGTSLLWLLCCLPLVTFFPACIALYDSVAHCVYGPESRPFRRFFRTLKAELFRGIGLTLAWFMLGAVLFFGFHVLATMGQQSRMAAIYSMVYLGTMLVPLGVLVWLIPIESRFVHTFGSLHKTALTFAFINLPKTALLIVILIVTMAVLMYVPFLMVLLPSVMVTLQCTLIERVFKRYEAGEF